MKSLIFWVFLIPILLSSSKISFAQEETCGYIPDQQYLSSCKDTNSVLNKRIQFLRKYSINEVYQMERIESDNGQFNIIRPNIIQNEDIDGEELLGYSRIVPVVAHIIRRSNGTGGLSTTALNDAVELANNYYSDFNLQLVVCSIQFIDSDAIFNTNFRSTNESSSNPNASFNVLEVQDRNVNRRLNIYFAPNSNTSWTWRPNSDNRRQHIFMLNSQATNETTLSHEIGHWFDLLHTHGASNSVLTDELANGSNCVTAGDFVCDTPADPMLSGRVNGSCEYVGGSDIVDSNGDTFNPDPKNLMSYAGVCRNKFSEGQEYRMQSAFLGMNEDRGYTFSTCGSGVIVAGKNGKKGRFLAVWKDKMDEELTVFGDNWSGFTMRWKNLSKNKGMRLSDLNVVRINGKINYNGIFQKGTGKYALYQYSSWSKFTKEWKKQSKKGLRLIDLETFKSNGKRYYTGVFRGGNGKYALYQYSSWSKFTKEWKKQSKKGLRLIDLETFKSNGKRYYVGVFKGGKGKYALYQLESWKKLTQKWKELNKKGQRLVDIERFKAGNKIYYVGVWRGGSGAYGLYLYNNWDQFIAKREELYKKDYKMVDMEQMVN